MIFVTVGNDFRSFDRLLKKMDEIALSIPSEIVMQRGYSKYHPKNVKQFDFVSMNESVEYIRRSDLVVSHAGIGTVILCKEYGIPILIIPRRKKNGEHMNDHQLEIAKALENKENENIYILYEEDRLKDSILEILQAKRKKSAEKNVGKANLVRAIKEFVKAT